MPSNDEAVAHICDRDTRVFNDLFSEHFLTLTQSVAKMVNSKEVAADLVQDVFLRLWSGRAELRVRGDITHYLRRAARNRALDWLAHESVHERWEQSEVNEAVRSIENADAPDSEVAEDARLVLESALMEMPEKRRRICELRWLKGVGPSEIARRLGISVKTVETQLSRGVKELRQGSRKE